MTKRGNHQYASVDCTSQSGTAVDTKEDVKNMPSFTVYSKSTALLRVKNPKTFDVEVMKSVVVDAPGL
jgi:hypothetical protein